MSAYRGHLTTVVGDGPEVVIKLSGQWVRVLTPDGQVHTWPSADVRVTGISGDRFWLAFDGEIAVFAPEEPDAFMLEFLPGLKAARTVADALAAAQPPDTLPGDDDRQSWVPGEGPRVEEAEDGEPRAVPLPDIDEEPRPARRAVRRISARKPRLPQLAEHVEANRNGSIIAAEAPAGSAPIAPDQCDHDWDPSDRATRTCRHCGVRELIPDRLPSVDTSAEGPAERVEVDLTDRTLAAGSAADEDSEDVREDGSEDMADSDNGAAASANGQNSLLRSLASRHQAFQKEHRGTYRPKR